MNNLSRFPQPVELDLRRSKGCRPVELIGGVHFPPIGELPYLLTLGRARLLLVPLPVRRRRARCDGTAGQCPTALRWTLESSGRPALVRRQGPAVSRSPAVELAAPGRPGSAADRARGSCTYDDGDDSDDLPAAARRCTEPRTTWPRLVGSDVGHDERRPARLRRACTTARSPTPGWRHRSGGDRGVPGLQHGAPAPRRSRGRPEPGHRRRGAVQHLAGLRRRRTSSRCSAGRSRASTPTSRCTPALAERGLHARRQAARLDRLAELDGTATVSLAMLQEFLRGATEGWELAMTSVRDLLRRGRPARRRGRRRLRRRGRAARARPPPRCTLMLRRRAAHRRPADADELAARAEPMHARLDAALPGARAGAVRRGLRRGLRRARRARRAACPVQRIHGDLHLGQVLRTSTAGSSSTSRASRPGRSPSGAPLDSPAARRRRHAALLRLRGPAPARRRPRATPSAAYRADEWAERNRDAFCAGYAEGGRP